MQIGLLGLGNIGKHHLDILMHNKNVSKVHVYTPKSVNFQPKLHVHTSEDSLLNSVEGVIIASPNL